MSDHRPTVWLVCYDVRDDGRRRKVYQVVRAYGEMLQFSVYRCVLGPVRYEHLRRELLHAINSSVDSVLLIPLGKADAKRTWRMHVLGEPPIPYDDGPKVF